MTTKRKFDKIVIIGVGLIGGSLALALKRKGCEATIVGVDAPEVLENAKKSKAIDESYLRDELEKAVADADLIFLCTPLLDILRILQIIGKYLKPNTLVTDVGGTKRKIAEMANLYLPAHCDFIGGHPMAGSEERGIKAADPFLFENTVYVLTPGRPVSESNRKALGELLEMIGAKVLLLQPSLHDEIAAAVSHLPQMAAVALMNLVAKRQEESPHFLKMAAGGFRDMTRIASSPYSIWEDVRQTNHDMIAEYIDAYILELQKIKAAIETEALETVFDRAARSRLSIPKDTKGFLRPNFDVLVSVEDKPGMIAQIANTLAPENINVKDIEVLKVREDEGGTMRLAFASDDDRKNAIKLLKAQGFTCKKRGSNG